MSLSKEKLSELYLAKKNSTAIIAKTFGCSENKVNYWLIRHGIQKRSIAEAMYVKHNPAGDPFKIKLPKTIDEGMLWGLGLGLYWGEGTKANKHSIRLGNTDSRLIRKFIDFLIHSCNIKEEKLRFGLQIFSDTRAKEAVRFWCKELGVSLSQFQKVIVTPSRGSGTYRNKSKYGVLVVQFHNRKLRDIICDTINTLT